MLLQTHRSLYQPQLSAFPLQGLSGKINYLLRRHPVVRIIRIRKPLLVEFAVLGLSSHSVFPERPNGIILIAYFDQGRMEHVKGRNIANRRLGLGQFEGLADTAVIMGLVGMTEENLSFPCLAYKGPSISSRTPLTETAIPQFRRGEEKAAKAAGPTTTITYLKEHRIFALFDALINQIQRLLHVLTVNGILDLLVAPIKDGIVGGRHGGCRS